MAKKSKKKRMARYDYSYQTKDSGGGTGVFKFDSSVKFYKPKEGKNKIIIVPYFIKNKNHPLVKLGIAEIGETDYLMDYWEHPRVGPREVNIVCLKETYHKRCPVCELMKEYQRKGMEDEVEALKAKHRVIYNVYDASNMDAGMKVFAVSHFLFEKELVEEAHSEGEGEREMVLFAELDEGKVISFRASTEKWNGREYFKFKSFSFLDRKDYQQLDIDDAENAISFDEVMTILSYEEIETILNGMEDDEEEEKETKRERRNRKVEDDKEEEEEEEDEDEEEKPRSRRRRVNKSEEDENEEEEPKGKRGKKTEGSKCPHDHKFSVDCDKYKECDDCEEWDVCSEEQESK